MTGIMRPKLSYLICATPGVAARSYVRCSAEPVSLVTPRSTWRYCWRRATRATTFSAPTTRQCGRSWTTPNSTMYLVITVACSLRTRILMTPRDDRPTSRSY